MWLRLDDLAGDLSEDPRPSKPHLHETWLLTEGDGKLTVVIHLSTIKSLHQEG